MTASSAAPGDVHKLQPASRASMGRAPTSRLARTDPALLARTDEARVPVVVKLDHDAVASYAGGLPGLAPTSPSVTGRQLGAGAAERAYEGYLRQREGRFTEALAERLPDARVGRPLRTVYGGVTVTLPASQVKKLLAIDGVVAVQRDELREALTDSSSRFIGADTVQQQLGGAAGARDAGKGVIVGVLDTGAWPEHPSLADQGNLGAPPAKRDGSPRACDFGDNPLTSAKDVFRCNRKLIGGASFLDAYLEQNPKERYRSARDSDGHGTHTSTTAAGNVLASAKVLGVERGPIRGIAPGAWVSVYKVCGATGCYSSDSALAVAQAVKDGVDVINFSISGGTDPFTDPVEMAFLDAYAAGVFVAASSGNSGPAEGTANHLSPWVTTVAASTQRREFASTLTLTSYGKTTKLSGVSVTGGAGPARVVRAGGTPGYPGGAKCEKPAKPGLFSGVIVVCERGVNARVEKGWNVLQGGAAGMILYNPTLQDVETDNHWLPTVHLADDAVLRSLAGSGVTATISAGVAADGTGDVMAAFSSRGPVGLALKPDLTAPGVQILAGHTPTPDGVGGGPKGELFQAIAGTSMSSPQVAGSAALLAAAHPGWTPGQLKSALMTTAVTAVRKEDLTTPADPLDMGAGRIALEGAVEPGLTIAETSKRMHALADDEVNAVHLNLPSINAPVMPGRLSTERVVRNVSGQTRTWTTASTAPESSSITVRPAAFTLAPDATAKITVSIASSAVSDGYLFGAVRITPAKPGVPELHLPVAFRPRQGRVTLAGGCERSRLALGETTSCTVDAHNTGYEDASVRLRTSLGPSARIDSVRGARVEQPDPWHIGADVKLAGVVPAVPALSDLAGRHWRPLAGEGVTADPIGDEEVVNYDVPSFTYAGERFARLGVVSNGYLVVGGGTVQDVRFAPPAGPDAAQPNNVLAPFWSDLDGGRDEGIRVASVAEQGHDWVVVEWQVKHYGTQERRRFQVWLRAGGQEEIRFAYDRSVPQEGVHPFAVGAENARGEGVLAASLPDGDVRVASSGGRPGGRISYTVRLRGLAIGPPNALTTALSSPDLPGTTVLKAWLRVVGPLG